MYKILESLDRPLQVSITPDIILNQSIVQVISMIIVILFFLTTITKTLLFIKFSVSLNADTVASEQNLFTLFIKCSARWIKSSLQTINLCSQLGIVSKFGMKQG